VHSIAPNSPFFRAWAEKRKDQVIEFVSALKRHNFNKIGEMIEYDTLCLHAITMTADESNNLILWSPETIKIMRLTKILRKKGIPVFYSIDTGPSVVLMTTEKYYKEVIDNLNSNIENLEISLGKIGGPSEILKSRSSDSLIYLLRDDIDKFGS
jgi:diphosphomevalonate decarboxylase